MAIPDRPIVYSVILAAGGARRFGSPKQLALFRGQTLLENALNTATEVTGAHRLCVIGANAQAMLAALTRAATGFVYNRSWSEGQSTSIRAAISGVPGNADAVLIWHADQVLISAEALHRLLSRWRTQPDAVVAARFDGGPGAPAIFPRRLFEALTQLDGDRGAKRLIFDDRNAVTVPMPEASSDIDTPADLARVIAEQRISRADD